MALVAVLSLTDLTQLWHLAAVSFAAGAGLAFYWPAYTAWLPALVPESDLQAVNGFEGMIRPTIQQAIGPGRRRTDRGCRFPGCGVRGRASASALGLLALTAVPKTPVRRRPRRRPRRAPGPVGAGGHEGGVRLHGADALAAVVADLRSMMVLVIMGPLDVLIPFLIKDHLGGGPGDHALVLAAFGIGGAVGSIAMGAVRMPRRYLTLMNLAWGVACLPMIWMGVATHVWEVVVAAFICGALFSAPMVVWGTLLQRRVPAELVGRVASLDFFVSLSLMPVSMALAGPVSEAIGLRTTFFIAGVVPWSSPPWPSGWPSCPRTRSPTRSPTSPPPSVECHRDVARRRCRSARRDLVACLNRFGLSRRCFGRPHGGRPEAPQPQAVGHHEHRRDAIAAPASIGFSRPAAASGRAATL